MKMLRMMFILVLVVMATMACANMGKETSQTKAAGKEVAMGMMVEYDYYDIPMSLFDWREAVDFNVPGDAAFGGILTGETTPGLMAYDGATNGNQIICWPPGNTDPIITQMTLPIDLPAGSFVYLRIIGVAEDDDDYPVDMAGTVFYGSAAGFDDGVTVYMDEAFGTSFNGGGRQMIVEPADIMAGARTVTVQIAPTPHAEGAVKVSALWLQYALPE